MILAYPNFGVIFGALAIIFICYENCTHQSNYYDLAR